MTDNIATLETLDNILLDTTEFARESLKEKGGLIPMVIGYTPSNHKILIGIPFDNDKQKEQGLLVAKLILAYKNANRYTFFSESWFSHKNDIRPSEDPEKKEALLILGVARKGKKSIMYEIKRDENDNFLEYGDKIETGSMSGPFTELLSDKPLTASEKLDIEKYVKQFGININEEN